MVETTIDLDAVAEHEFIIKADFDEDLQGKMAMPHVHFYRVCAL